jgi:hypothetical protein
LRGLRGFEAEVAGGEVELLVVERVVGDVHLAVEVGDGAVFFDGDGGVVIQARRSTFKKTGDEDDAGLAADAGEGVGGGAGDGLGEREEGVVFALAEVLGAEELGEADDVGALAGCLVDALGGLVQIELRVWVAGHLDEGDAFDGGVGHGFHLLSYRVQGEGICELIGRQECGCGCVGAVGAIYELRSCGGEIQKLWWCFSFFHGGFLLR